LASNWLEYQYGWKPLLSDLYEATVKYYGNPRPKVFRAASAGEMEIFSPATTNFVGYTRTSPTYKKVKVKVVVEFTINDTSLATLSEWGIVDPLALAWELTPYSFVVDWFSSIGDYLSTLNLSGITFTRGYWDVHKDYSISVTCTPKFLLGAGLGKLQGLPPGTYGISGAFTSRAYSFKRELMSDFPMGQIYLKSNPFSTEHVANAIALLRQLFK
jgi:hypothetical protein